MKIRLRSGKQITHCIRKSRREFLWRKTICEICDVFCNMLSSFYFSLSISLIFFCVLSLFASPDVVCCLNKTNRLACVAYILWLLTALRMAPAIYKVYNQAFRVCICSRARRCHRLVARYIVMANIPKTRIDLFTSCDLCIILVLFCLCRPCHPCTSLSLMFLFRCFFRLTLCHDHCRRSLNM